MTRAYRQWVYETVKEFGCTQAEVEHEALKKSIYGVLFINDYDNLVFLYNQRGVYDLDDYKGIDNSYELSGDFTKARYTGNIMNIKLLAYDI